MAVTDQSSVIIQIDLEDTQAIQRAEDLGKELASLKTAQKELSTQNKQTSASYAENRQKIIDLNREQKAYVQLAKTADGSNKSLRAQLSLLTGQYDALGKAERDNTTAGKALQVQIASINRELLKSESSTGRFQRNVGNYNQSVAQAVGSLGSQGLATVGGFGFMPQASAAITAFKTTIGFVTQAVTQYKTAQELANAATVASVEVTNLETAADIAAAEAAQAKAVADEAVAAAEKLRISAETKLAAIQAGVLEEEEARVAILAQIAIEQEAIAAEETARIATETALSAAEAENVALTEARVAAEAQLTVATAASAAAIDAEAASLGVLKIALATTGIGAVLLLVASLTTYLKDLDTVTDTASQVWAGLKAQVGEFGRTIMNLDFKDLFKNLQNVGIEARFLTGEMQNLEDSMLAQSVKSADAQAKVARLQIEARNRTLGPEARQQLIKQADLIDADDLKRKLELADRDVKFAQLSMQITGNLTKFQRDQLAKRGVDYALYLQNNLSSQGKVTDDQTKALAKALKDRIQVSNEYTQREEKRQNLSDRIAEQADKKAEALAQKEKERQQALERINEDRAKSELETSKEVLTQYQIDIREINNDINKRKVLYEKYGQDTTQLEKERASRIRQVTQKFNTESLAKLQEYQNQATNLQIGLIKDDTYRQVAQIEQSTKEKLQAIDKQILALASKAAFGDPVNPGELQAQIDVRNAIIAKGEADKGAILGDASYKEYQQSHQELLDRQKEEIAYRQFEEDGLERRLEINATLAQSYEDLFGAIADLTGKNTAIGKIAFAIEQAYAIQRVLIAANEARAKIGFATATAVAQAEAASVITFGASLLAIPFIIASGAAEETAVTVGEIASIASIAAATVQGIGKAKGGIQYESDGKGAILPGYATKDNTNAFLRSGEAVIVSEAARDPHTRSLLSAINVAYGGRDFSTPGYAMGGLYGGSYLQQTNSDMAGAAIAQNKMLEVIRSQKIYTAITEIRIADARYTELVDNANH